MGSFLDLTKSSSKLPWIDTATSVGEKQRTLERQRVEHSDLQPDSELRRSREMGRDLKLVEGIP